MKAFGTWTLCALVVAFLAAGLSMYRRIEVREAEYLAKEAKYLQMYNQEQATRQMYDEVTEGIASIQQSISEINIGVGGAQSLQSDLDSEKAMTRGRSEAARAQIRLIEERVAATRAHILQLENDIAARDKKVIGLQRIVANLRTELARIESVVEAQTKRIAELEATVVDLTQEVADTREQLDYSAATVQAQAADLEASQREAETIYYIVGTKDDLKREGVIDERGGLLGIGKSVVLTGRFDSPRFMALRCAQDTVIGFGTQEARVLSQQPVGSYRVENRRGRWQLHIVEPVLFRTQKHLVVMTD